MKMSDGFKTFFRNINIFDNPHYTHDIFTCTFYNKDKSECVKFSYYSTFGRRLSDGEFNFVRRFYDYTRVHKYETVYSESRVNAKEMLDTIKSLISRSNWIEKLDKNSYVLSIGGEYVRITVYNDSVFIYYLTQEVGNGNITNTQINRIRDCLDTITE